MRHGSLFSGIGGFDLAAEWMGWENVFHCEWNPFGQRVLHHYWPNAETFTDITKTDFKKYEGTIDIISGGFPCQPYSSAGKRKGKEDERHLWPEMCRAIREISPSFVVGENVRGLTNWNGGLVFDEVCSELESIGYQVAPVIIPACAVNAPHRRERIWFVAFNTKSARNSEVGKICKGQNNECVGICVVNENATDTKRFRLEHSNQTRDIRSEETTTRKKGSKSTNEFETNGSNATNATSFGFCGNGTAEQSQLETFGTRNGVGEENVANTNSNGLNQRNSNDEINPSEGRINAQRNTNKIPPNWNKFPTQPPICGGDDGLSTELDGITFSKWRNESIKGYGNAIVPQVAYEIFKAIEKTI